MMKMRKKILMAGVLAGLLLSFLNCFNFAAQGSSCFAAGKTKKKTGAPPSLAEINANHYGIPKDAPKDIKYLVGLYYGNGENILIREARGRLELLYRTRREDLSFDTANIFPLEKQRFDSYLLKEAGPMSSSEVSVEFERDTDGFGITCKIGGHRYSRYYFGYSEGERSRSYHLPPHTASTWEQLRLEALQAALPAKLAEGVHADLLSAAQIPGVIVRSLYATEANIFGAPLYLRSNLYLSRAAAAALAKAQTKLAAYGYGIVLWDAYRPWSVSKLANLALPEKGKGLLPDPETLGSSHNTGNAVDVALYELADANIVEMISAYDELSPRQYTSYAGGTERQRWLRDLLRSAMLEAGFSGMEMEWWHFEYNDSRNYAHLNIPLEALE